MPTVLSQSFQYAEDEVRQRGQELASTLGDPKIREMGTTACVMYLDETNNKLIFANAGDSGAYICGNFVLITSDGVSDVLTIEDMQHTINSNSKEDPNTIAKILVDNAKKDPTMRSKHDDRTVIVLRVPGLQNPDNNLYKLTLDDNKITSGLPIANQWDIQRNLGSVTTKEDLARLGLNTAFLNRNVISNSLGGGGNIGVSPTLYTIDMNDPLKIQVSNKTSYVYDLAHPMPVEEITVEDTGGFEPEKVEDDYSRIRLPEGTPICVVRSDRRLQYGWTITQNLAGGDVKISNSQEGVHKTIPAKDVGKYINMLNISPKTLAEVSTVEQFIAFVHDQAKNNVDSPISTKNTNMSPEDYALMVYDVFKSKTGLERITRKGDLRTKAHVLMMKG
jgi:hypothetical protein